MDRIGTLFGDRAKPQKPRRASERGDLFDTLLSRLNPSRIRDGRRPITYKRLGYLLTGIKTADLYALLSKMDDAARRGVPAGVVFWTEIKPKKQTP